MKITKLEISKFRGFHNQNFDLGSQITAIAGQNGTQKSTLLGLITQTFTLKKDNPMRQDRPLCGGSYISQFKDKFRLSPTFDTPGNHEWTLMFDGYKSSFTVESIKRTDSDIVRFWKKGARQAGDGYMDYPTIFLSMKRLLPLAEDDSVISTDDNSLSDEEKEEYKILHNKILIAQTPIISTTGITSKNKQSVGVSTSFYDWNQNSMGQDNLGKIVLALFSFKRLKAKFPNDYKGGILAIDELDATMYPASQHELLKVLRKYASELNLQIIFTTHSLSLLRAVDELRIETCARPETSHHVRLVYLKRLDNEIQIKNDIDYKSIMLDLNVVAEGINRKKHKVMVYTEDNENITFAKAILKRRVSDLQFIDVSISCSKLVDLVSMKVPAFTCPHSIIILDGDVRENKSMFKKIRNAKNVLVLPGRESPERMLARYLYNLSDADGLWTRLALGYSKQVCFREYSYEQIMETRENGRQNAKKWFNSQLAFWGRGAVKVLNPLFDSISQERDSFVANFDKMILNFIHD